MQNWIKKFAYNEDDPRRESLKPTFAEVEKYKAKGRTWSWELEEQMLLREFGLIQSGKDAATEAGAEAREEGAP